MGDMRLIGLSLLALVVLGCGSGNDTCAPRAGTFRITFSERSGDCGLGTFETIETVTDQTGMLGSDCTGQAVNSDDMCSVTLIDVACPADNGFSTKLNGKVNWNDAGTLGTGQMSLIGYDQAGALSCTSLLNVTYTKL